MVSSSAPRPVTMMRRSGRAALKLAITSNRFPPSRLPSSAISASWCRATSPSEDAISSKSLSSSNSARKPTNRSGSLSTTAIRIFGLLARAGFILSSLWNLRSISLIGYSSKHLKGLVLMIAKRFAVAVLALACLSGPLLGQETYKPMFKGDPAHSHPEAGALGYMRTVVDAQRAYKKKHNKYATSLQQLVHNGSFTRRMAKTD